MSVISWSEVKVTLSVRVRIEISGTPSSNMKQSVTLSVRVWIEMSACSADMPLRMSHPQCEGVD